MLAKEITIITERAPRSREAGKSSRSFFLSTRVNHSLTTHCALRFLAALSAVCVTVLAIPLAHAEAADRGQRCLGAGHRARTEGSGCIPGDPEPLGRPLVGVRSPAAKSAEIHSMSNDGGVMKMRRWTGWICQPVRSCGWSRAAITSCCSISSSPSRPGARVPLTLILEQKGKKKSIQVQAEVRAVSALATVWLAGLLSRSPLISSSSTHCRSNAAA